MRHVMKRSSGWICCLAVGFVAYAALADSPKDKRSIKINSEAAEAKSVNPDAITPQAVSNKAVGAKVKSVKGALPMRAERSRAIDVQKSLAIDSLVVDPPSLGGSMGGVAGAGVYYSGFEGAEGYDLGDLDTQEGWDLNGPSAYVVSESNPALGTQHVRCQPAYTPDGSFPYTVADSPVLATPATQMSVDFNIGNTGGADYGVFGFEGTTYAFGVRFYWDDADGDTIPGDILTIEPDGEGGLAWTPTGAEHTPDTYQTLTVVIDDGAGTIEYALDGTPFWTGAVIGATGISQVRFGDDQYQGAERGDFDNLLIGEGGEIDACCLGGGPSHCDMLTAVDCATAGGTLMPGVTCGQLNACTTGACCDGGTCSQISWSATCGGTYYGDGTQCENVTCPPANDDCDDSIEAFDGTVAYSTAGATTDGPASETCDEYGDDQVSQDIWYFYTATCDGYASFSLCDSAFDTKMAVYEDCNCPVTETRILDCDDESCGEPGSGVPSEVEVEVVNGNCYLVRVGGYGSATGEGVLEITCETPVCGNGINEAGEDCDDGNLTDGDGCSDDCHYEGACCIGLDCYELYTLEECETGGGLWGGSESECKCIDCPYCGDGVVNLEEEECDDGNTVDDDLCGNDCLYNGPANDNCDDKETVTDGSFVFNTFGTTTDGLEESLCDFSVGDNQIHNDVWYNYIATATGPITIDLSNSSYDTRMAVYEGCTCLPTSDDLIGCDDDSGAGLTSLISFDGTMGLCYKIRIGGYDEDSAGAGEGMITVCGNSVIEDGEECDPPGASCDAACQRIADCGDGLVDDPEECDDGNLDPGDGCDGSCMWEIPTNDDCANAIVAIDGTNDFTTNGATTDGPDEATCFDTTSTAISNDIWYTYMPVDDGVLTIHTCGQTDFDTRIAVYDNAGCAPVTGLVTCDDDFCGVESYVSFNATGGETYLIRLGGYDGDSGEGSFFLSLCQYECTPNDLEGVCSDGGGFVDIDDACSDDPANTDFTDLAIGTSMCATSGSYNDGVDDLRDVDWYHINVPAETNLKVTVEADFWMDFAAFEIDLADPDPCETLASLTSDTLQIEPCYEFEVSGCLPAGDYVFVVAPYLLTECGSAYTISVSEEPCATGACCLPDGTCSAETINSCVDLDGVIYYGEDVLCSDEEVACPPEQLCLSKTDEKCQRPDQDGHGIDDTLAATSDREAGYTVAEDFTPTESDTITTVCWWGMYHDFGTGDDCAGEWPDNFVITFYESNGPNGAPGTVIGQYTQDVNMTVSAQSTTLPLNGHTEWEFSADLDTPVSVTGNVCYWVEISNALNCNCAWLWETAGPGNERAMQDEDGDGFELPDDEIFYDMAMCLTMETADLGDLTNCDFPPDNDLCDSAILVFDGTTEFNNVNATTDGPPHGDCSTEGSDPGNDCCTGEVGDGPGCGNFDCEFIVCSVYGDSYCCTDDWDDQCALEAAALCSACDPAGVDLFMADIWYLYQASCDGTATIQTCDTGVDTKLAVYDTLVCPVTGTDLIECNDDNEDCDPAGSGSQVEIAVASGDWVTIRVGGWAGLTGTGVLSIECGGGEPTGSCCNTDDYTCTDDVTEAACAYNWTEGGTCAVDCVAPTGACCNESTEVCTDDVTEAACTGDVTWYEGQTCGEIDCPSVSNTCVNDLDCVGYDNTVNGCCAWDKCGGITPGYCDPPIPNMFGDVCGADFPLPPNGTVNLTDVLCTLNAFGLGNLGNCPNADVVIVSAGDCPGGNAVVNLTDILKVLDAFGAPSSPSATFFCDCPENP